MSSMRITVSLCVLVHLINPAFGEEPLFSEQEKKSFDMLYSAKIRALSTAKARGKVAKELLAAAEQFDGGMKYLILTGAKDLATKARDTVTVISALEQMVAMKSASEKDFLKELLEWQIKRYKKERTKIRPGQARKDKEFYKRCTAIVDNALRLYKMNVAVLDFKGAEKAVKDTAPAAAFISSPKTSQLRHQQKIAAELGRRYRVGKMAAKEKPTTAIWAYLDVGAYEKAQKLVGDDVDDVIRTSIDIGLDRDVARDSVFNAAIAWDERAQKAKGTLREIRFTRAAQLYERCLAGADDLNSKVAKARLLAINEELGAVLDALRKPTEWVYLVDMPMESSKVGFGRLGVVTADRGPIGIAGQKIATGFKAHANSRIVFRLHGKYREFSTYFGLTTGAGGASRFKIVADGKTLYTSPGMWKNNNWAARKPTKVSIVGVDRLELISDAVAMAGAWSAWGDPKVR